MRRPHSLFGAALVVVAALALAGCTSPEPAPTTSKTPTASATPTPTDAPDPEPVLGGTATENKPFFDWINQELIASGVALNGAAFIDSLVGAGYPREAMEVTPDVTSINIPADNIVFSIRFGDECLLGQWGNIGYTSGIATVLSTGRCIVGTERPA